MFLFVPQRLKPDSSAALRRARMTGVESQLLVQRFANFRQCLAFDFSLKIDCHWPELLDILMLRFFQLN